MTLRHSPSKMARHRSISRPVWSKATNALCGGRGPSPPTLRTPSIKRKRVERFRFSTLRGSLLNGDVIVSTVVARTATTSVASADHRFDELQLFNERL